VFHGAKTRAPVLEGKQRVRGLWQRSSANGRTVFESQFRQDGRVRRVTHPDTYTKTEAIVAHRRLVGDVSEGKVQIGDRSLTVRALAESFLAREQGVLGARKRTTIDGYRSQLDTHVLPLLGARKADQLTVQHVRSFIDTLTAQGHSPSLVRRSLSALSVVLRHGVRDLGAVRQNPVRELDRGERPSGRRRSEPRYLSVTEVGQLLGKMTDQSRPVTAALFYGALRVSEALALVWSDVDFESGTLTVRGTKTDASAAMIPLLPALATELRTHRQRQAGKAIDRIRPDALVFQTASGNPLHRRNVLRAVQRAARAAGLNGEGREPVGCHDLRHSCAALAFSLGMTPVEVSRLLRHSNSAVTLSIYAGLDDATVANLGEKLSAGLQR
jgi:integrase